jgi:hypothetical protein
MRGDGRLDVSVVEGTPGWLYGAPLEVGVLGPLQVADSYARTD